MELRKFTPMMNLRLLTLFLVLAILFPPIVTASESAYVLDIQGQWKPATRSIKPSIPITASIDSRILSIENTSPDCDIIITIINESGEIVYEQKVPAINTANICIPISEFPTGEYTLELTNPSGNYLRGNFTLYQ